MTTMNNQLIIERNNVKVLGNGKQVLMFAHGYGCDQHMWRYVYPAFKEDYTVVLFDYVGAGGSDLSAYSAEKYSSLDGYTSDVLEICQTLGLEDVILIGHSVSAMVGVLAAIKEPERFSHLILVCPSPKYINDGDYTGGFTEGDIQGLMEALESNYLGWSAQMAPVIMGNPDKPALGEELTNSFCRTNPEIAKKFAQVTFLSDNRKDLSLVETPTLILQSTEDVIAPQAVGEYVHRNIKNSVFHQMKATGHCPNLSAPEETIEAIKNYLEGVLQ